MGRKSANPRFMLLGPCLAIVSFGGCREDSPPAADSDPSPVAAHAAPRPDIVLVSIDSLRADHLGCYGYDRPTSPVIDALAADGVRFENAIATTSWTLPSHAAMFTGMYDSAHGLVDDKERLAEKHVTLAEVLRDAGYQTAGFYGGPYLHPAFGVAQGFDAYQSCMTEIADDISGEDVLRVARAPGGPSHRDITGPRTLDEFGAWLKGAEDRPMFVFLHMWDVHYDYIPPAEYLEMFDPDYQGTITGERYMQNQAVSAEMDPRDLQHIIARYDGEIRFTDDILGRIFALMKEAGRLEDALIVITADHGEEFFEHGYKGHQRTLFDEVIRVPLIFHWAGRLKAGTVVPDQVRLIDLMPTLLSLAGVDSPAPLQGRDLSPLLGGDTMPAEPALAELLVGDHRLGALRTNELKLVADTGREWPIEYYYDLREDPGEQNPLGEVNEAVQKMKARYLATTLQNQTWRHQVKAREAPAASPPVDLDPGIRERLRGLGYIGDADDDAGGGERPDAGTNG